MNTLTAPEYTPESLRNAWQALKQEEPKLRIRSAAHKLGVSEGALLASQIGMDATRRLHGDWGTFLKALPSLGRVMSLTRNDSCVLEHKGCFEEVSVFGSGTHQMGQVIGPIETRVFLNRWHIGYYVETETPRGWLQSFQIFDTSGTAITKIYAQRETDMTAFNTLLEAYTAEDQTPGDTFTPYTPPEYAQEIDTEAFRESWRNLQDTHHFFGMLRKYNVHRQDALAHVEGEFSERTPISSAWEILKRASEEDLPIMIFAGNRGNLQIHQGPVKKVVEMDAWYNVLDPHFNLHLNHPQLDKAWIVRKPTSDGLVTSIECFDHAGDLAVQFFGLRKPGNPELEAWRVLVDRLERL